MLTTPKSSFGNKSNYRTFFVLESHFQDIERFPLVENNVLAAGYPNLSFSVTVPLANLSSCDWVNNEQNYNFRFYDSTEGCKNVTFGNTVISCIISNQTNTSMAISTLVLNTSSIIDDVDVCVECSAPQETTQCSPRIRVQS